jgi:transcriptional regulator with XRE-family HTH domain
MLPTPEEALRILGSTMRAARLARGLTQQGVAREAQVSRGNLERLESGENVSLLFLLKIARFLDLSEISLDGKVRLISGQSGTDVTQLLQTLDLLDLVAGRLRDLAVGGVLPASERAESHDAAAVRAFVARHAGDPDGLARLSAAIAQLSSESTAPPRVSESKPAAARRARKRSSGR